jgi:hypothetical protein
MTATWQSRDPNENAPIEQGDNESAAAQESRNRAVVDSAERATCPASAAVPMFNFHSHHDFRGAPEMIPICQSCGQSIFSHGQFPSVYCKDHHDHRDFGLHDLKRDPGREWERGQPEKIPGVG